VVSFIAMTPFLGACWETDMCDPGQVVQDDLCYPAPPPHVPKVDAGGTGDASAPLDTFGKACSAPGDCAGGNATICGAPQLPLCTQIDCLAGEANEGVCPAGWQCLTVPPNPSVCLKL
jgi:hypothetical protein